MTPVAEPRHEKQLSEMGLRPIQGTGNVCLVGVRITKDQ